jgi:hypothetical protein
MGDLSGESGVLRHDAGTPPTNRKENAKGAKDREGRKRDADALDVSFCAFCVLLRLLRFQFGSRFQFGLEHFREFR